MEKENKKIPIQLQRAIADGSFDKVSKYLSAAYLLQSIVMKYVDNSSDILRSKGLFTHTIKREANAVDFHFCRLHEVFFRMVKADKKESDFNEDYDKLVKIIEQFIEK